MTNQKTPMTVAALIEQLKQYDPTEVVMIYVASECASMPLSQELFEKGHAVLVAPHEWTRDQDEYGKPVYPRKYQCPGGWVIEEEYFGGQPISERHPCLVITADW